MDILKNVEYNIKGDDNIKIKNINFDSRKIDKDSLFVALKGYNVDGHNFIDKAIENGAVAVLCSMLPKTLNKNISYIIVKNTSDVLGKIASNFYDKPSSNLKLIGIQVLTEKLQ